MFEENVEIDAKEKEERRKKLESKKLERDSILSKTSPKEIIVKNKSRQKIGLNFKHISSIVLRPGETISLTKELFESDYFQNRIKYFSVMKGV